ncbi:hypothetical protein LQ953_13425 [Sphingomonas sp. IC-56]|uniref:hypothetical protein n=1 Tax=Sphingomonas sp. IC-56 TaxID=2898529 RepID=UPI001E319AA8|nr:hypothetical protein [Sphingomonas sp. IC-56]MCD2325019.1 hypothetical protein [Sphingomonas sp. IC-56]
MAEVRALQERLIEIVSQGDAAWFEEQPDRRIRMRNAVAMEFNTNLGEPPVGMSWRALVVEAQPGARARQPIALPISVENGSLNEQELFALFVQVAPPEAKAIIDRLRRVKLAGAPKAAAG